MGLPLYFQAVTPGYDALVPKAQTVIDLLDETIGTLTANQAVVEVVGNAMQSLLGLMDALTAQYNLNAEAIMAVYGDGEAAYGACIRGKGVLVKYGFNVTKDSGEAEGRRRLQQSESDTFDAVDEEYLLTDTIGKERSRYAGMKGNAVFGGLFMHQVGMAVRLHCCLYCTSDVHSACQLWQRLLGFKSHRHLCQVECLTTESRGADLVLLCDHAPCRVLILPAYGASQPTEMLQLFICSIPC